MDCADSLCACGNFDGGNPLLAERQGAADRHIRLWLLCHVRFCRDFANVIVDFAVNRAWRGGYETSNDDVRRQTFRDAL